MLNKSLALLIAISIVFISFAFAQQEEVITLTTLYPSPYGIFETLQLFPNNDITPGSSCANDGEMTYYDGDNMLYVCSEGTWQLAGGYSLWAEGTGINADDIYNTNAGNIGVGTDEPTAKLDIEGNIRISGGNPALGKVLTAIDTYGNAVWTELPDCINISSQRILRSISGSARSTSYFVECPEGYTVVSGGGICHVFQSYIEASFPYNMGGRDGWYYTCKSGECPPANVGTPSCCVWGINCTHWRPPMAFTATAGLARCCRTVSITAE